MVKKLLSVLSLLCGWLKVLNLLRQGCENKCAVHKAHMYLECHSVCPLVRIGTPHPLSRMRMFTSSTAEPKGGGTRLRMRGGGGGFNSDDWRKGPALCLLCGAASQIVNYGKPGAAAGLEGEQQQQQWVLSSRLQPLGPRQRGRGGGGHQPGGGQEARQPARQAGQVLPEVFYQR